VIVKWLQTGKEQLIAVSDTPELEASWLLSKALQQTEGWLLTHPEASLTTEQKQQYTSWLDERQTGKPLAYILGEWEFYGRSFKVSPEVLIPRPESEEIIEQAKRLIPKLQTAQGKRLRVADIGTGSGCLAVTLAIELRESIEKVVATDISPTALVVAKENARQHQVEEFIDFKQGRLLEPLAGEKIDLIVSNPPYIPREELNQDLKSKQKEKWGLRFEPRMALDGGEDGTEVTSQLQQATGPIIMEVTGGEVIVKF
jgi:release factor glutamine methyltransferase